MQRQQQAQAALHRAAQDRAAQDRQQQPQQLPQQQGAPSCSAGGDRQAAPAKGQGARGGKSLPQQRR
jgi:hypothetical protein